MEKQAIIIGTLASLAFFFPFVVNAEQDYQKALNIIQAYPSQSDAISLLQNYQEFEGMKAIAFSTSGPIGDMWASVGGGSQAEGKKEFHRRAGSAELEQFYADLVAAAVQECEKHVYYGMKPCKPLMVDDKFVWTD